MPAMTLQSCKYFQASRANAGEDFSGGLDDFFLSRGMQL